MFDQSGRVFLHPSSVLFSESGFKSGYLAYFSKAETSKVFLRDATEVRPVAYLSPIDVVEVLMSPLTHRCRCMAYCCSGATSRSTTGPAGLCWAKMGM
jgi:hypothetical protein